MARLVSTLSLEKGTPNTTTAHLLLVMQRPAGAECGGSHCGGGHASVQPQPVWGLTNTWADSPQRRAEGLDHSTGRPSAGTHQQTSEEIANPATCATISTVLTNTQLDMC